MNQSARIVPLALLLCLIFLPRPLPAQPGADAKLDSFFRAYLDEHFRRQPLEATGLGDHRFDNLLDDISPQAREGWLAFARQELRELPRQVDYHQLTRDGQIDFEIFQHELHTDIWLAENTHPFEEDPRVYGSYINDGVYLLLTQSTQPKETNIANCLARMAEIPRILAGARDTLTHPPQPILEMAIRQNRGAISFYEKDLFDLVGQTDHSIISNRPPPPSPANCGTTKSSWKTNSCLAPPANGAWAKKSLSTKWN